MTDIQVTERGRGEKGRREKGTERERGGERERRRVSGIGRGRERMFYQHAG